MQKYKFLSKKGEGTFSEVIKASLVSSPSKVVAIKRMKNHFESLEQVNNLREVQALKKLSPHPGIIKLYEVIFERSTGRLSLVFELMEQNIYELIRGRRHYLSERRVKSIMYQLIKAIDHIHRNGIFHRDIKPENILIDNDKVKLADFGSCRGVKSQHPFTEYISTRWYRAPECLLTDGYYNYKMDMWGIGCVFFEIIALFPLFPGTNELDQITKIHNIIGTPSQELLGKLKKSAHMSFNFPFTVGTGIDRLLPNCTAECIDLIKKLLAYNPDERLSARQALRHPYFKELRDLEKGSKGSSLYNTINESSMPSGLPDEAATTNSSSTSTSITTNTTNIANKKDEKTDKKTLPQLKNKGNLSNSTTTTNTTNTINTNSLTTTSLLHPNHPLASSNNSNASINNTNNSSHSISDANRASGNKSLPDIPTIAKSLGSHTNNEKESQSIIAPKDGNSHAIKLPVKEMNSLSIANNKKSQLPTLIPKQQTLELVIEQKSHPHKETIPKEIIPKQSPKGANNANGPPLPSIKGNNWKSRA